ncbi:glycoside hydrolase family 1 protein [Sphingomonas lycopersici]|uniref:beta-glucosidase n=1 Tax=Sphingomonas lycopersici TaxID=2951807 RepID=A0AA42CNK7_9SPHN|nr:family 1 glycosylhydrolase [Sphingomonas lycopersici]MCW6533434.1 family 1 glycosylhydrolase [Sphingomonas lycopersici]
MTMIDRRGAIGALAGGAAALPLAGAATGASRPGFLWGVATAGHQVEGNNVNADIWLLEQVKPTVFAEPSGDACDSLHRWREDVALVKALGLNCYRFSVEWSRIEPAPGQFSQAYLDHYARMVDHCRAQGIAPVVTLNHFTCPRWFAAAGGWLQKDAPDLFARFCDKVARAMAAGMSHALTFNEPNGPLAEPWSLNPPSAAVRAQVAACVAAAGKASGSDRFSLLNGGDPEPMIPGITAAHVKARDAIRAVRGDLPVGMSLAIPDDVPAGADSAIERKRAAVYGPFFAVMDKDDFVGVQTYHRTYIGREREVAAPPDAPRRADGSDWFPAAVGNAARYAHKVTGKPIFVTENGIGTPDDAERARFIPAAVASVEAAMRDGVPVIGYLHWSLLDNFEWVSGYGPKFGLVAVDRTTFKRTVKPSARILSRIARAGGTARA